MILKAFSAFFVAAIIFIITCNGQRDEAELLQRCLKEDLNAMNASCLTYCVLYRGVVLAEKNRVIPRTKEQIEAYLRRARIPITIPPNCLERAANQAPPCDAVRILVQCVMEVNKSILGPMLCNRIPANSP